MDGLTFWATIIQAFAWPLFCAGFLLAFRSHVTRILTHVASASRPAAWQFVFQVELQRARVVARSLPWRARQEPARSGQERGPGPFQRPMRAVEDMSGKALPGGRQGVTLIVEAWDAAARQCSETSRKRMHHSENVSFESLVVGLHGKGRIEAAVLHLFCHLQSARDAACHGGDVSALETQDFVELVDQLERAVVTSLDGAAQAQNGARPAEGPGMLQPVGGGFRQSLRTE